MRKREAGKQTRLAAVVEVGDEPVLLLFGDQPAGIGGKHAVDHQAVLIGAHSADSGGQRHRAAVDRVAIGAEPVRPRVQDRNTHRFAGGQIGAKAASLTQQLYAAVGQRGADHARRRNEGRCQGGRRVFENDGGQLGHGRIVP